MKGFFDPEIIPFCFCKVCGGVSGPFCSGQLYRATRLDLPSDISSMTTGAAPARRTFYTNEKIHFYRLRSEVMLF